MSRKLTELPTTDTAAPAKPKRISKKIKAAIGAMASGDVKNWTAAAKKAGISREHLSRSLALSHVQDLYRQKAFRTISAGAPRAAAVKVALLESSSEIVRDRASSFILSMSGISPENEVAKRPGALPAGLTIVIMPPDPPARKTPETIDVKPAQPGALPR